ncbi:MAG: hypothetical protein SFT94_03120 [Pseudanabaenaceae cyanobacterium bins.68]|nr:hypothetical protein [Pseudanabaenaceae cyanobacterium bins.68]
MKLVKHEGGVMVFKPNLGLSGRLAAILFGLLFSALPVAFFTLLLRELGNTAVSCDRLAWSQINCQITKTGFGGLITNEAQQVNWVQSAKQVAIYGRDSDGDRTADYKTEIRTKFGSVIFGEGLMAVNGVRGSASESLFVAEAINQFVNSRLNRFTANLNSSFAIQNIFMLLFIIPFLLIGFFPLYQSLEFKTLILDRNQRQIIFQHYSLLGWRVKSWPLSECQKVVIEDYTDSYDNTSFTPVIMLNGQQKFSLERVSHRDQAVLIANQIHRFLLLPLIPNA